MPRPRTFLCNGATPPADSAPLEESEVAILDTEAPIENVHIRFEDVSDVFLTNLTGRWIDLLEIAAYVYSADAAVSRGTGWSDDYTRESWERELTLRIAVRDHEFWSSQEVQGLLHETLTFLSDDPWQIYFTPLRRDQHVQGYLELGRAPLPLTEGSTVTLFSGGLDSLAGAVESLSAGELLALVSHRPVAKMYSRQRDLFDAICTRFPGQAIHIPVWLNKDSTLGRENTQRTRSFVYASLGAVVAQALGSSTIRFFENGVVSLNLPVADEVLGARASRTTHPWALDRMERLLTLVAARPLRVENPYLLRTKADVVRVLEQCNATDLIPYTCSCQHTGHFQTRTQWHCGACSQCIDRRVAMFACGLQAADPERDYVTDVFVGRRKPGADRNMAVNYVRHVHELSRMSPEQLTTAFNVYLTRAVRPFAKRSQVAEELVQLHLRHGRDALKVITDRLAENVNALISGNLDPSSLLSVVAGGEHLTSVWRRYAESIAARLRAAVPIACRSRKPQNEPQLQEICDGILVGQSDELIREFPFLRWGSVMTKPDWSLDALLLWVELKYVRKRPDVRIITKDIAEDITKYGDSNRRTLFVVYDPTCILTNEQQLVRQVEAHEHMLLRIIR